VTLPVIFLRNPARAWLGVDGTYQDTLFVEVASKDPSTTYQWYLKNEDGSSTIVEGAQSDSLFLTKDQYGIVEEGKVYQFFCLVNSGAQYGISGTGRVAYGPGGFIANNGWLKLAPYNLGATITDLAGQLAYEPTAAASGDANDKNYDPTVYGDWYQWGRKKDGHENRKIPATGTYKVIASDVDGLATTYLDAYGQVTSGDAVGKFIERTGGIIDWRQYPGGANTADSPAHSWTWGSPQDGITDSDPCKSLNAAWRVPTQLEWAQLSANNTWIWKEGGATRISGYEIKPAGLTKQTSLFLPAAGRRNANNSVQNDVGAYGYYWSSTPTNTSAFRQYFTSTSITSAYVTTRSLGLTVRCVVE
jgi:uncharacterized protein (TIGR02145 family)